MAVISQVGIVDGQVLYAEHILRIINALSALSNNDILISGNLYNTGSFYQVGTSSFNGDSVQISSSLFILPISVSNNESLTRILVIDPTTGRISYRNSSALTGSGAYSGSFSGSFQGDGSGLTGIVGVDGSKWTGSLDISRLGNVQVTGSLRITSALTSSIISASSGITGSLFGTSSWAINSSQSISSSVAISASILPNNSIDYVKIVTQSGIGVIGKWLSGSSNFTFLQATTNSGVVLREDSGVLSFGPITSPGAFDDRVITLSKIVTQSAYSFLANPSMSNQGLEVWSLNTIPFFTSSITGSPTVSTFLRGDGNWASISSISGSSSGSFSGSFQGDGSGLTGISGGSSKWTGSTDISRLGTVSITGSLNVSSSTVSNIIGTSRFTGPITASIISASSGITGSLLGTASVAVSASWAPSSGGSSKWTGSSDISRLGNVTVSGSFEVSGSGGNIIGATLFTGPISASIISGSAVTGSLLGTASWAVSASWAPGSSNNSGSFSGSFQGDGSQLTGIAGGSSKWTGSTTISRLSDVNITGSFVVSGSNQVNVLGTTQFTGPITASLISASSNITASGLYITGTLEYNILGASQFTGPITASFISSSGTFRLSGSTAAIITGSMLLSGTLQVLGAGNISLNSNAGITLQSVGDLDLNGGNAISYLRSTNTVIISSPLLTIGSTLGGLPRVSLTGSLIVSGTANNGTGGITGSLLGTSSFALTASYAYNTINPAVNSDQRYFESTDFAGTVQGDLGIFIGGTQFGGGVVFSDQYGIGTAENVLGVFRIFTGTSTSGSGWMYKGYSGGFGNAYLFGRGNALIGRWRVAISNSLSSSNNDIWTASIGFMDNGTNNSYGAYFRWSPAENSGKWRAILQKGLTSSSLDTGVVANTSYSIFQIESNVSGTAVTFSIDGNPVASGSSNISTGSAESFAWWVHAQKASGSTDRGLAIDWYSLGLFRNEPR